MTSFLIHYERNDIPHNIIVEASSPLEAIELAGDVLQESLEDDESFEILEVTKLD